MESPSRDLIHLPNSRRKFLRRQSFSTRPQSSLTDLGNVQSTDALLGMGDRFMLTSVADQSTLSDSSFDINNVNWNSYLKEKTIKIFTAIRKQLQQRQPFSSKTSTSARAIAAPTTANSIKEPKPRNPLRKIKRVSHKSTVRLRSAASFKFPKFTFKFPSTANIFRRSVFNFENFKAKAGNRILKVVETLVKIHGNTDEEKITEEFPYLPVSTEYRALLAMFRDSDDLLAEFNKDIDLLQYVLEMKDKDDKRETATAQRIVTDLQTIVQTITQKIINYEDQRKLHFEKVSSAIEEHRTEAEELIDEYFHFRDLAFLELENKIVAVLRRFDQQHEALFDAGSDLENMQTRRVLVEQLLDIIMGIVQILQGIINHVVFLWLFHPAYRVRTLSWSIIFISVTTIFYGNGLMYLSLRYPKQVLRLVSESFYRGAIEILWIIFHGILLPTIKIPQGIFYGILGCIEIIIPMVFK